MDNKNYAKNTKETIALSSKVHLLKMWAGYQYKRKASKEYKESTKHFNHQIHNLEIVSPIYTVHMEPTPTVYENTLIKHPAKTS